MLTKAEFVKMVETCPDEKMVAGHWCLGDHRCCVMAVLRHHYGVDVVEEVGVLRTEKDVASLLDIDAYDLEEIIDAVDDSEGWDIRLRDKNTILKRLEEVC